MLQILMHDALPFVRAAMYSRGRRGEEGRGGPDGPSCHSLLVRAPLPAGSDQRRRGYMNITPLSIPDVMIVEPERFSDQRGFFSETYNRRALAERGIELEFVQDSHSLSGRKGTIRGLHYQSPPFAQAKLIRVVRGSILDVAVDLRRGSPTYARHVAAVISAAPGIRSWSRSGLPTGSARWSRTPRSSTR